MKKDFVKGIAVGCALSIAIGGASALADTYRKFLKWLTLTSKLS